MCLWVWFGVVVFFLISLYLQIWGKVRYFYSEKANNRCTQLWASLLAQTVKNLPTVQETQVCSLDQEDPLEKGMATHSSILAWRIPWREEPGGLQTMELKRVRLN